MTAKPEAPAPEPQWDTTPNYKGLPQNEAERALETRTADNAADLLTFHDHNAPDAEPWMFCQCAECKRAAAVIAGGN